jgi:hypothetical protein
VGLWRDWKCIDRYAAQGFAAAKDIFLILGWLVVFTRIYWWPGPIHEGNGIRRMIVEERATEQQRNKVGPARNS